MIQTEFLHINIKNNLESIAESVDEWAAAPNINSDWQLKEVLGVLSLLDLHLEYLLEGTRSVYETD